MKYVASCLWAVILAAFVAAPLTVHAVEPSTVTANTISEPGSYGLMGYAPYHVEWFNASNTVVVLMSDTNAFDPIDLGPGEKKGADVSKSTTYRISGSDPAVTSKITILGPLSQTSVTSARVSLGWGTVPGAATYDINRTKSGTTTKLSNTTCLTTCSYADTTIDPGSTYTYSVKALTSGGATIITSNTITVAVPANQPPSAPTALQARVTGNTIALSWNASTDDDNVTDYQIYSSSNPIATAYTNQYVFKDGVAGKTYSFTVKARDKDGLLSSSSETVTAKLEAAAATPKPASTASPAVEASATPIPTPAFTQLLKIVVDNQEFTPNPLSILKVEAGKVIHLSGTTKVGASLMLSVYSEKKTAAVTPDASGNWSYDIVTADLGTGDHKATISENGGDEASLLQFTIVSKTQATTAPTTRTPLQTAAIFGIALALIGLAVSGFILLRAKLRAKRAAAATTSEHVLPYTEPTPPTLPELPEDQS